MKIHKNNSLVELSKILADELELKYGLEKAIKLTSEQRDIASKICEPVVVLIFIFVGLNGVYVFHGQAQYKLDLGFLDVEFGPIFIFASYFIINMLFAIRIPFFSRVVLLEHAVTELISRMDGKNESYTFSLIMLSHSNNYGAALAHLADKNGIQRRSFDVAHFINSRFLIAALVFAAYATLVVSLYRMIQWQGSVGWIYVGILVLNQILMSFLFLRLVFPLNLPKGTYEPKTCNK